MYKLIKFFLIVIFLQGCVTKNDDLLSTDITIAYAKAEWRVNSDCESYDLKITEKSNYFEIEEMALKTFKQITNSHDYFEKGHPPYVEFDDNLKPKIVTYESPYKKRKIILIAHDELEELEDTSYLICNTYEKTAPDWELLTVFNEGRQSKIRPFTLKEIDELQIMKSEFNIVE